MIAFDGLFKYDPQALLHFSRFVVPHNERMCFTRNAIMTLSSQQFVFFGSFPFIDSKKKKNGEKWKKMD